MTRLQLIQQVALRMDEVSPEIEVADLTVDGSDGNPLYTLIDGLVDGGALELFSVAPYWRLQQKIFGDSSIDFETVGSERKFNDGDGTITQREAIRLKVPDDFLRVAEINHESFLRPITEVVEESSDVARRQHNPYLMAKEAKPVGVMSHGVWETGNETTHCREIDCFSVKEEDAVVGKVVATYIPKPETIVDGETEQTSVSVEQAVPPVLIPALEWLIAARTFGARGDANHAAICQQNAQNLLV